MKYYSFSYMFARSFKSFFRNGFMSFASVLILTACLFVTGCLGLVTYNLYVNLETLSELNEIVCEIKLDIDEETARSLEAEILKLDNVKQVVFVSKEEAMDQMREKYAAHPEILAMYEETGENPLPYVYKVTYESTDEVLTLKNNLGKFEQFESINDRIGITKTIENIKNTVLIVFIGLLIILIFTSAVIIMNTISMAITSRSKEITVMRYVGATSFFISFPFVLESLIIGIISTCIAFGTQYGVYSFLTRAVSTSSGISKFIQVVPFSEVWLYVLLAFVVISFLTCFTASKISLSKHIKV